MDWIRKTWFPLLLGLILLAGSLAMVNGIQSRSLFIDEAFFIRNVAKFPGGYFISMAPSAPLFYSFSYVLMNVLGKSEWVFRLTPFIGAVAGCAMLLLFLGKHFSKPAALISALLLVFSFPLNHYASNAHPFTVDFLCATALCLITHRLLREYSLRTWIGFVAVSLLSALSSFPSVFVIASCAAILLAVEAGRNDRRVLFEKIAGLAVLALSIGAVIVLLYLRQSSRPDLPFWADFLPPSRRPAALLKFAHSKTVLLFGFLFFFRDSGLAGLFLAVLGTAWFIGKKQTHFGLFCWMPLGLTIAASFAKKWPYGPVRTDLFLMPFLLILMASGMEWIWQSAANRASRVLVVCSLLLLPVPQAWMAKKIVVPAGDPEEAIKTLSRSVKHLIREGDVFLVYCGAEAEFRFYFPEQVPAAVFQPWSSKGNRKELESFVETAATGRSGRVWIIYGYLTKGDDEIMLTAAKRRGNSVLSRSAPGCGAVLFEFPDRAQRQRP
jgi:4-amino-4-deoxy-L-arabinose transferase-like glycosyltransferase